MVTHSNCWKNTLSTEEIPLLLNNYKRHSEKQIRNKSQLRSERAPLLQEMGVPLERDQLNDISERLAKNDDGKIYYG